MENKGKQEYVRPYCSVCLFIGEDVIRTSGGESGTWDTTTSEFIFEDFEW